MTSQSLQNTHVVRILDCGKMSQKQEDARPFAKTYMRPTTLRCRTKEIAFASRFPARPAC